MRGSRCGTNWPPMTLSLLFHPLTTFVAGIILASAAIILFLSSCAAPNRSAAGVAEFRKVEAAIPPSGMEPGSAAETAAIDRFKSFLQGLLLCPTKR